MIIKFLMLFFEFSLIIVINVSGLKEIGLGDNGLLGGLMRDGLIGGLG